MTNKYTETWFDVFVEPIQPSQMQKEIEFLTYHLPNPPYKTVLDVCCGQGRHSNLLATKNYHVTGIDLNIKALEIAKQTSNGDSVYHKVDMRNLRDISGTFNSVVNLWQSYGYFDGATNKDILKQMSSKLNPGGRLILDIYHRGFFEKHQGTKRFQKNGLNIIEEKSISGNRLFVTLNYGSAYEPDSFEWELYTPDEIIEMAKEVRLTELSVCTGFDIQEQASDKSPRMQIVFEKN